MNRHRALIVAATACLALADSSPARATQGADAPGPREDPHAQLQQILEQPAYQRWKLRQLRAAADDSGESVFLKHVRNMMRSAAEGLRNLLRKFFRGWQAPTWSLSAGDISAMLATLKIAAWAALAAVLVFIAALLYKIVRSRRTAPNPARVLSRHQVRRALEDGQALAMGGSQWLQEAGRLSGEGDFRAVYRAMYLALLSGLHTAGRIEFRKSRTNWSYVSRFKGPQEHRRVFGELTTLFDDVWYGLKPQSALDLETIKRKVAQLVGSDSA